MPSPYLSKSDFKACCDCRTKLFYRKNRYPTNLDENEYLKFRKTFKETVSRSHVVSFFRSTADLKRKFTAVIPALFVREKIGPESRELEVLVSKLPRATWLNEDRLSFRIKELGDLNSSFSRRMVLKEVLEL